MVTLLPYAGSGRHRKRAKGLQKGEVAFLQHGGRALAEDLLQILQGDLQVLEHRPQN